MGAMGKHNRGEKARRCMEHIKRHGGVRLPDGAVHPIDHRAAQDILDLHGPEEIISLWPKVAALHGVPLCSECGRAWLDA